MTSRRTARARLTLAGVSAVVTLLLIPGSLLAQSDSTPKWDLFAGYQWTHPGATVPTGDPDSPTPFTVPDMTKGVGGALTYNVDHNWGAEVDLGYSHGQSNTEATISVGPRLMWRTDDGNYFVHALISYNDLNVPPLGRNNGLGAILGGGWDLPITKFFAWRVVEANYVWGRHNYADFASPDFPSLRRMSAEGVRLSTGLVFSWGYEEPVSPAASCSVQPTEVLVGEPITATASASNFNPKHTVTYDWSGNGGQVTGKDTTASIDTTNAAPGSYTLTVHVTDPKASKNNVASCTANYTVKPLPPKNPPTMNISANPTDLVQGGTVNLSASCSSPDGVPVSVANWTSTAGSVSGAGTSASLSTAGLPAGSVTVTASCTDSRGLTAQASTQFTVENPPPPPPQVDKALEARLALHSVYFPTAQPPASDPNKGLVESQQKILMELATDFKTYLQAKPDAHLVLQGHADIRGPAEYNQKLSERRVARVKSFLVEQGVPESDIETEAFGAQHNLTLEEVKQSIQNRTDLTVEEIKRALREILVLKLASNRRVDVTLKSAGQTENSVRQFPFNAADALTLIGGRESEMKKPAKPAPKKPVKK
jgi:outer membrane protein OmpA-like peptidoglycan-associated protein